MAPPSDDYETAARREAWRLESAGKLPDGFTDAYYPLTRAERIDLRRLRAAFELALDPDACRDLLDGLPVDPDRVDKTALEHALAATLIQLVRPIDVVHGRIP